MRSRSATLPRLAALALLSSGVPLAAAQATLLEFVRAGDSSAALALVAQRADVNAAMPDGTTSLHWAAHNGDAMLVRALLKAGANAKASNDYGATPMAEAAERGDAVILKLLLAAGADVDSPNPEGQTALMTVARSNHLDAARVLLAKRASVNAVEHWRGQSALMWAAAQSQPDMVRLLIRHGADVNQRSAIREWPRKVTAEPRPQNRPPGGLTALLLAAREGCVDCARALVAGKADINLADPDNITPLLMATLNARFDVAAELIRARADVNRWDTWGRAPLYAAVDFNTVPRGGRPDRPSLDVTTALDVIRMLLDAGANPNMQLKLFPPYRSLGQDRGGDGILSIGATPLVRAAKAGDVESVKLLLAHGALPDLPTLQGVTPLMAAAGIGFTVVDTRGRFRSEAQCVESARLLIAAGVDVNAARDNGQTALHAAAQSGYNEFVQLLASERANLGATDQGGLTALDVALGKVGPNNRNRTEVHEDTAALLRRLLAAQSATTSR